MSPETWRRIQRVCAGALSILGIVGLVAVLVLSNTIVAQLRQLDPLQKEIAVTLETAAKTVLAVEGEMGGVEPVFKSVPPLLANVDEVLASLDSTLGSIEIGLKAAQPPLDVVVKMAEKDVPEVLAVGSKTIGTGEEVLGEIRGGLWEVSRNTNRAEIVVVNNRKQLDDTMTATRQELARYQPGVVTPKDIYQTGDYIDSLGLSLSTIPLRDHARWLALNGLEYWIGPNETYVISPASLRQLADSLDTTGLALDTNILRQQAEELERQGLVVQFGVDPALVALEASLGAGADIAVATTRETEVTFRAVDKTLAEAQKPLVVARKLLKKLQGEAPVFATGVRAAHEVTITAGQDLAVMRARITEARQQISQAGTAVPATQKTVETTRKNLVILGNNLEVNAVGVQSLPLAQMTIQIVSWITWIAAGLFLGLALIGGYWLASTFKLPGSSR